MTSGQGMIILLKISFVLGFSGEFTDDEKMMTESFITQLNIRSCIILKEDQERMNYYDYYKTFFKYNITTVIYRRNRLQKFVNAKPFNLNGVKSMIFVRTSSLEKLAPFLTKIKKFLHYFIWWIILDQSVYYNEIPKIPIPYNCKFIFAQSNETGTYKLTEIYSLWLRPSFFELTFGEWTRKAGLVQTSHSFFSRKKLNFNGTEMFLLGNKICLNVRECFHREIWNGLGYMLNFRTTSIEHLGENDIKDAKSNSRVFNSAAYRYTNTIRPILKIKVYIFIRQPMMVQGLPNYFIKPFKPELWMAIFIWILLATVLIVMLWIWLNHNIKEKILVTELAFVPFETFCNQEGSTPPKRLSFRMAYLAIRISALFVIPAYSAFLVTYLSIRTPEPPFNNLETFAKIGTYKLGWVNAIENSYNYYYFKVSNDPIIKQIGQKFLTPKREIKNQTQGLAKMCKEKYAHMGYVEDIRQTKAPCKVFRIKAPVYSAFTAISLDTSSPYGKIFNMKLIKFYENGILHKMQSILDEWQEEEPGNKEDDDKDYPPVEIQQMIFVLAVIPIGVIISFVALIFEWIHKKLIQKIFK